MPLLELELELDEEQLFRLSSHALLFLLPSRPHGAQKHGAQEALPPPPLLLFLSPL
ncbi:MAG: hypothetical protein Q9M13_01760 [Mariprofundales bacterium]|nr:hypothetical protein [Mariprofundales bacterium]